MDVAAGVTISTYYRRHRHQEFLRFLKEIEDNLPAGLDVHLVMDNYGTHKVAKVRNWLARHPRYHVRGPDLGAPMYSLLFLSVISFLVSLILTALFSGGMAASGLARPPRR